MVIPAKARKDMVFSKGEQLLFFGMGRGMLVLSKLSNVQKFAAHMEDRLKDLKKIIKNK